MAQADAGRCSISQPGFCIARLIWCGNGDENYVRTLSICSSQIHGIRPDDRDAALGIRIDNAKLRLLPPAPFTSDLLIVRTSLSKIKAASSSGECMQVQADDLQISGVRDLGKVESTC